MIYSIKRFSAIQEKLFAKSPQFLIRDVYMEGIKLVEMWSSFTDARGRVGQHTPHWINLMSDKIFKIGESFEGRCQNFFVPLDPVPSKLPPSTTKFYKDYSGGRKPEEIMRDEINFVCTMTRNGEVKYANQIKKQGGVSRTPEDYLYFFKYLALSLSGQYSGGPWDNIYLIQSTPVNYKRQGPKFRDFKQLQDTLQGLFVKYLGPNDFIN